MIVARAGQSITTNGYQTSRPTAAISHEKTRFDANACETRREVYDVEKEILDLERQKRALEVTPWRDIQELRVAVADERREQHATRRRIDFLAGGE